MLFRSDYLDRPGKAAYDLLCHLNDNADEADWSASSAGNTFVEYTRDTLLERANEFRVHEQAHAEREGRTPKLDRRPPVEGRRDHAAPDLVREPVSRVARRGSGRANLNRYFRIT